mgnify:CR=1 FL=1|jgi:hypothetical protein
MSEWQPIETAPRDGREMILLIGLSGWPGVGWSDTWWTRNYTAGGVPTHWMRIEPLPVPPPRD